jgi:hypothetical protein
MKVIETLSGAGEVLQSGKTIRTTQYELQVLQEHVDGEPGLIQVVGRIDQDAAFALFSQEGMRLVLQDGRSIEFFIKNSSGEIRCSGGFSQAS